MLKRPLSSSVALVPALFGALLMTACGQKPKEAKAKNPSSDVRLSFQSDEARAKQVASLEKQLGFKIESDPSLTLDNEFLANNVLRMLKAEGAKIKKKNPKIEKIILVDGKSVLSTRTNDLLVFKVGVESSRADILAGILGVYEAAEDLDAAAVRKAVEDRLFISSLRDLVSANPAQSENMSRKAERALQGLHLRRAEAIGATPSRENGLEIIMADRFGVSETALAIDASASDAEITEFAREALGAIERSHKALKAVNARVGFTVSIQPLVLDVEAFETATKLVESIGDNFVTSRRISTLVIGTRFESSTTIDPTKSIAAVVKFDASKEKVLEYIQSMPMTYEEEGRSIVSLLENERVLKDAGVKVEAVVPQTGESVDQLRRLSAAVRAGLKPAMITRLTLTKVRLGFASSHSHSSGTLELAFDGRDTRTAADYLKTLE